VEELRIKTAGDSNEEVLNMTSAPYLSINATSNHFTNFTLHVADASSLNNNTIILPQPNATEWAWLPSTETCIYVNIFLILATIFVIILTVISFFTLCMRASVRLHNSMFTSITHATMWFFNNNPSGKWNVRLEVIVIYLRHLLYFFSTQ
jgi:hypothetical protein